MVLGGYFTWVQLSDMRAQLIERGQLIAEQLAPLAATALARKDTAVLNRIANEALDQPDVRAVTFLDARQERLAHAGPSMLTVAPAGDASHLSMSTELDTTHFLLPVLGRHHSLSGATEPDDERVLGWVELELSHHGTLLRGYRSLFTSLLLIAAGLGVTALLALRMSRAINAPLELISQGVAQLGRPHGNPPATDGQQRAGRTGLRHQPHGGNAAERPGGNATQHRPGHRGRTAEPGNHRDPEHRAGPGAQGGPGGEQDQVRVPRQHEPRDPHPAQRHPRFHQPAAEERAQPAPAGLPHDHPEIGGKPAGDHQRDPRLSKIEAGKLVLENLPSISAT